MKKLLTFLSIYLVQLFVCFFVYAHTLELTPRINFYDQSKIPPKLIKNQISKIKKSNNISNFNGAKVKSNTSAIGSQIALSWGKYFSSSYSDRIYKTAIDANDNVICVGSVGYGTNDIDAVIYKYDKSGNLLWSKEPASSSGYDAIYDVETDVSGNIYITGEFYSSAFGEQIVSNGGYDIFIAKYSPEGTLLWAKNAGSGDYDYSSGIALDQTGNVYVVGFFNGTANWNGISKTSSTQGDMFIAKYDNNGKILWVRNGDIGENGYLFGIDTDKSGNVYVSSNLSGDTHFEGAPTISTTGAKDMLLIKYDTSGNFVWIKTAGGIGDDGGNDVKVDSDGNILVAGYFSDNAKFENTNLTAHGSVDIFAAKYSSSGKLIWVKQFGGTGSQSAWAVNLDEKNNCYLAGWFSGTGAFDNSTIVSIGSSDAYIIKYDKNGNLIWVEPTATGLDKQLCASVFVKANNLAISGYYLGEMNIQGSFFPNSGDEDGYVALLTQSDVTAPAIIINPGLTISTSQIKAGQSITFFGKQFSPVGKVDLNFSGAGTINSIIDYAIDVNGNFQYTVSTSTSQKFGEYVVIATDKISGKSTSRNFQIVQDQSTVIDDYLKITQPNMSKIRFVGDPIILAWTDKVKFNVNPLFNYKHSYTVKYKIDTEIQSGNWQLFNDFNGINNGYGNINLSTLFTPTKAGKYTLSITDNYYPNRAVITPEITIGEYVNQDINIDFKWDKNSNKVQSQPEGAAADGVARFYMVVSNKVNAGVSIKSVKVTLSDNGQNQTTQTTQYLGKVKYCSTQNDEEYTDDANDANSIIMQNLSSNSDGKYWFWYVAPDDFSRNENDWNLSERKVIATFEITLTNGVVILPIKKEITIVRPPLMLVHGLNGDPSTWDNFRIGASYPIYFDEIKDTEKSRFKVINALAMLKSAHFNDNANLLLASIDKSNDNRSFEYSINQIREKGYACNQVDYICHSMGGSMLRSAADKESSFKRNRNYTKGFVHKFITLDTPHQGSSLANVLEDLEGDRITYALLVGNSLLSKYFPQFYNLKNGVPRITDAVYDLKYKGGIKFEKLDIPSNLIGGGTNCPNLNLFTKTIFNTIRINQFELFSNGYSGLSDVISGCDWWSNYFQKNNLESAFTEDSDGVVSLTSQFNGENVNNLPSYCTKVKEPLVHTSALGSPYPAGDNEVFDKVNKLLNSAVKSTEFGNLAATKNSASLTSSAERKVNKVKSSIDITKLKVLYPVENQEYNAEDTMVVKIKVDTVGLKYISVYFQDQIINTLPTDTIMNFNLTVNPDYIEGQTLSAVGTFQMADQWSRIIYSTNLNVNPKGSIIDFNVTPELVIIQKGHSEKPTYEAVYPGSISEIGNSNLFTVAINDPAIISYVDTTNSFTGLAAGSTNATITYKGITKTVFFEVLDPQESDVDNPNAIESINYDNHSIDVKTYPNPFTENFTFEFTVPKSDKTRLEIYNVYGVKVRAFDFDIQAEGFYQKTIDMKGLTPGIYIYKLTSGMSTQQGSVVKL